MASKYYGLMMAALVCGTVSLNGCGKGDSAAGSAGMASGTVLGEDQKPIAIPGAQIEVHVSGVAKDSGQNITYSAVPDADGHYSAKIADGRYQANASIKVPFDGKTFMYELIPTGPKPRRQDQDAGDGPVFNFEWHTRGPRFESSNDVKDWTQWCGGPVNVHFDHYSLPPAPGGTYFFPPDKTKFVFTLKPTGKLVNGADGQPLTFERGYDSVMMDVDNQCLNDVPLGNYELSGKEVTPDGKQTPLVFSPSTDQKTYSPTAAVGFEPRGIAQEAMGQLYVFRIGG